MKILTNPKTLHKEEKTKCYQIKLATTKQADQKRYQHKITPLQRYTQIYRIQTWLRNQRNMARLWLRVGGTRQDEILWQQDRGRWGPYTHEEGWHGWKQSRIRGHIRPVTQEEGQVTWNERRDTWTWNPPPKKKPKTGHLSPRCDTDGLNQP